METTPTKSLEDILNEIANSKFELLFAPNFHKSSEGFKILVTYPGDDSPPYEQAADIFGISTSKISYHHGCRSMVVDSRDLPHGFIPTFKAYIELAE